MFTSEANTLVGAGSLKQRNSRSLLAACVTLGSHAISLFIPQIGKSLELPHANFFVQSVLPEDAHKYNLIFSWDAEHASEGVVK